MMYNFEEILDEKEIEILKQYNIPLQCERNMDVLWELLCSMPLTEEVEIIADKLMDNL